MSIWKLIENLVYIVFTCTLIIIIVAFFTFHQFMSEQCTTISDIANNEEIVNYLDDWATDNIVDKGYYFVAGMHGDITARKDESFIDITPLPDPSITNIELKHFRFGVRKIPGNFEDPITSRNVAMFDFGRGRDRVILLKNSERLTSYREHDIESGHLLKINENVYAYCANSRF